MQIFTTARLSLKILALAALLTLLTGFDREQQPDGPGAPEAATVPALQLPAPKLQDKEESRNSYNWRQEKEPAPTVAALSEPQPQVDTGTAQDTVLNWDTGAGKSYSIAAVEVPTFLVMLSLYDRIFNHDDMENGKRTYSSTFSTTWEHLSKQNWKYDTDPFNINQFAHPYQGATMYGLARSCGLGFWESWAYSNAGSFLWKMAGETDPPSINDMITTGNSGSLLGEALFRMSALVLNEGGSSPDAAHEIGAAIISPTTTTNRYLFGDRFKTIFPSHDPATFWRFRLGASLSGDSQQNATLDFAMSYGLPGKPGYTYQRPLDYFDFQIGGLSKADNVLNYVLLRGLLYGKRYEAGENYRGIWGLYGSYDYISPDIFRVSNTAVSLGTTGQYWVAPGVALQGTLLGGVGFGAAGVTPSADGQRDYHYGITPQTLLSLRMLFGTRAALELVGREYYVSGTGSDFSQGSENIVRVNANLNVRVYGRHGIGIQYVESIRDAKYGNLPSRRQNDGTVSLVYTFLGDSHFGAVEWRNLGDR
jgi:hypothetical protein